MIRELYFVFSNYKMLTRLNRLSQVIGSKSYRFCNEKELQDGIEQVLYYAGYTLKREVILSSRDRIDFVVDHIGIEIKVDGSTSSVIRQVHRYAQYDELDAILVVTTRSKHSLPSTISGKPIWVVYIPGWL